MLMEKAVDGVRFYTDERARGEGVLVAFTGREGGVSSPPYSSLNLGAFVGDDPASVATNRERAAAAIGFDPDTLVLARQVHGAGLIEVSEADTGVVGEADILVSRIPGKVIAILTADCVPVVLEGESAVAVAHAGWRGLVAGAIEAAIDAIGPVRRAWVGPSIHACCYEVGPEVVDAFRARSLPVTDPRHVDPGRAAVVALQRAGIAEVASTTDCTSCGEGHFSFRRDGITGRQGAFAGLIAR